MSCRPWKLMIRKAIHQRTAAETWLWPEGRVCIVAVIYAATDHRSDLGHVYMQYPSASAVRETMLHLRMFRQPCIIIRPGGGGAELDSRRSLAVRLLSFERLSRSRKALVSLVGRT